MYYFKRRSGISTWSRPLQGGSSQNHFTGAAAWSQPIIAPPPGGWTSETDLATGNIYYYHPTSGISYRPTEGRTSHSHATEALAELLSSLSLFQAGMEAPVQPVAATPDTKMSPYQCCICLVEDADTVCRPCRHCALCSPSCARHMASSDIPKCPICRWPIADTMQIFFG